MARSPRGTKTRKLSGTTDYVTPFISYMFGTKKRILVSFKLPPGTASDSVASSSVTNFRAANKLLLQLQMCYAGEATTVVS